MKQEDNNMFEEESEEFDMLVPPAPPFLRKVSTTTKFNFSAVDFVTQREGVVSDNYVIGEKLGSGGFGEVFCCVHKETGIERAVKILEKSHYCDEANEDVINEFNILKQLDHPNILKQIEMFIDDDHYYIVTEICRGGELFDEIETWGCFIEEDAGQLISRVLASINYCHKNGVIHRDLKPENILLEENKDLNSIKVIDFGLSRLVENNTEFTDLVGSSYYVAPEVLKGNHGAKADVWSCGVVAYILLSGFPPFDGHSDDAIKDEVLIGMVDFEDEIWEEVSEDAKDFIKYALTYDPEQRPSAEQALKHPWIVTCQKDSSNKLKQRESVNERALDALYNLERFNAQSKLKQATCAFIASQLVLKEEKQKIDELFRALDINSNGKLTKDDVRIGYQEHFGKELDEKMVEEMFERIDYDNTGFIEYSEFVIASMNEKDLLNSDKLRQAFSMFDTDGSGSIEKDELIHVLSFFGAVDESLDGDVISRIVKQVDENGDGEIDFEEFTAMMFKTAEEAVEEESRHLRETAHTQQSSHEDNEASVSHNSFYEAPLDDSMASVEVAEAQPQKRGSQRPAVKRISGAMGTKACLALFERNIQKNKERGHDSRIEFGMPPKRLSIASKFSHHRRKSKTMPTPVNSTLLFGKPSKEPLISKNSEHSPKTARARAAMFEEMIREKQSDGTSPRMSPKKLATGNNKAGTISA